MRSRLTDAALRIANAMEGTPEAAMAPVPFATPPSDALKQPRTPSTESILAAPAGRG